MKILVAGFCKTGTKSVEKALEILGYKVADYWALNMRHYDVWKNYMEGRGCLDDLRYMYAGFDVASDMPPNMYWRDFVKAFPDIKLIFMMREEDEWLKSWKKHWHGRNSGALSKPLAFFSPTARKCIQMFHLEAETFFKVRQHSFYKMYVGIPDSVMREVYREHNRSVMEEAPSEQLLILNLQDGWKPLCEFLEKPLPDADFPHCNKRAGLLVDQRANHPLFKQMYFEMRMTLAAIALFVFLLLLYGFGIL